MFMITSPDQSEHALPKAVCVCYLPRLTTSGRGGIGRRAALRSLWGNPWKFESSRPHQPANRGQVS